MKVKMQVEVSPKELRDALGLPDVAGIQADVIKAIKQKLQANMDDFDPITLFRSFISQGMVSAGELQKVVERVTNLGRVEPASGKKTSSKNKS